jgi:SAM-dependent methyltransferase
MSRPAKAALAVVVVLVCAIAFAWHVRESNKAVDAVNRTVTTDHRKDQCQKIRPSALAKKYLDHLHGIEIGASTQNSFDLKRSINVDFSDEQGGLWQSPNCAPAVVNLVALGDDLPFRDATLDYVVSAHVIEHFFDPVKALREWYRVIRPGGYIFIIAPHRDRTFDKDREVTPVAELMDRSTGKLRIADYARPVSPQAVARIPGGIEATPHRLVRDKRAAQLDEGWDYFDKDDHHHWSVWRTEDFVALVKRLGYPIVEVQDRDDKYGNGFTVVIQKEKLSAGSPARSRPAP